MVRKGSWSNGWNSVDWTETRVSSIAGPSTMSDSQQNPYAAPLSPGPAEAVPTAAETTRRKYLNHEASVKSIGSLYLLGAIFLIPAGVVTLVGALSMRRPGGEPAAIAVALGVSSSYLAVGCLQVATAIGLRRLRPWARIVAIVLSAIGLLVVPFGTIFCAYFLYLLLSQKGIVVFSEEYRTVIDDTPHIKYRTSIVAIIFLFLLLLLLGTSVFSFLALGSHS